MSMSLLNIDCKNFISLQFYFCCLDLLSSLDWPICFGITPAKSFTCPRSILTTQQNLRRKHQLHIIRSKSILTTQQNLRRKPRLHTFRSKSILTIRQGFRKTTQEGMAYYYQWWFYPQITNMFAKKGLPICCQKYTMDKFWKKKEDMAPYISYFQK